tara:strand:- start:213 stop:503 length:291 start_codon:yes stop_codon:yes gene_type:complete
MKYNVVWHVYARTQDSPPARLAYRITAERFLLSRSDAVFLYSLSLAFAFTLFRFLLFTLLLFFAFFIDYSCAIFSLKIYFLEVRFLFDDVLSTVFK